MDACHEVGINVPVYLSGGLNNEIAEKHSEWKEIGTSGACTGWIQSPLQPGYYKLCFNTAYLEHFCRLLREAVLMFPDADGIFIDIVNQGQCCCPKCMKDMLEQGFDPEKEEDRKRFARQVLLNYYRRTSETVWSIDPKMPLFHNSGNIAKGDTEILKYFTHLELESLPTGGWGYDHYPMSAAYSRKTGLEFLGMTGKFHTTWGEFGGFKHPNALRYECAAMLANGSKCSVGDQLHPCGKLDKSTYRIIGPAYREVAAKEPWCDHVKSGARIAVLGQESAGTGNVPGFPGDIGVSRLLLELHQPFDFLDARMPFDGYSMLILPDSVRPDKALAERLADFMDHGGKLVLSGTSGMMPDGNAFRFDIGAEYSGASPYDPDYICCAPEFAPEQISTPFVMYAHSQRIKAHDGVISLGKIHDPYFNRDFRHFCSHHHTPYRPEPSGFDAGTMGKSILYFAHPVFSIYRRYGNVILKKFIEKALKAFAGEEWQIETDMPSQGRITIMEQPGFDRAVIHLLYANTIPRGGGPSASVVEVIEDLNPTPVIHLSAAEKRPVKSIRIVPDGKPVPFTQENGRISLRLEPFVCHEMLEIQFE